MKVKLKKINLENYKKFTGQHVEFNFYDKTKVVGRNKEGKSTLSNAYMEVLTGKQVDGTQPDKIRPHDADGKDLNRSDVIREITLDIDGKETVIRKITKQKWRKPHGQTEEVLDGNSVSYEIDGYPYAPRKFDEYMKELLDPEKLLMCSNPNPFLSILKKSTAETRKLLECLSGFELNEFLKKHPEFSNVADITKGHSVEDAMKKLRKQLNDQKKKLAQKETELKYEQVREIESSDSIPELEKEVSDLKEQIREIEKQQETLDNATKQFDKANKELLELKKSLNEVENEANSELVSEKNSLLKQITDIKMQIKTLVNNENMEDMNYKHAGKSFERHTKERERLAEEYIKTKDIKFDETELNLVKEEVFDENKLVCPTCNQLFTEEQQSKIRENFDENKKARIAKLEKEKQNFQNIIQEKLKNISDDGMEQKRLIAEAKIIMEDALSKIKVAEEKTKELRKQLSSKQAELDALPESVSLDGNEKYLELKRKIEAKELELFSSEKTKEERFKLRNEYNKRMEEVSNINAHIMKIKSTVKDKEEKLSLLESEFDEQKQIVANIEKDMDILNQFSIEKNTALANEINPFFSHFQFSFLEYTQENNPVETCKLICDGTDYSELNGGDRKLVEADLCVGLQKMNGISLPVWIDESNTIDSWRLPEIEQQLILISRTDNELKVEQAK